MDGCTRILALAIPILMSLLFWYPDPALDIQKLTGLTADLTAMRSVLMGYDWVDYIGGTVKMRLLRLPNKLWMARAGTGLLIQIT